MATAAGKAHYAFMVLGMMLCAGLTAGLVVGWRWHGQEVQRLVAMRQQTPLPAPALLVPAVKSSQPASSAPVRRDEAPEEQARGAVSLLSALPDGELAESPDRRLNLGLPAPDEIRTLPLSEESSELQEALAVLDAYWKAQSWQEKMAYVWDAGRVGEKMRAYYAVNEGPEGRRGALSAAGRYLINGSEIIYLSHAGDRPLGVVEIGMRKTREGQWKLDWESYTGSGEMSWSEFKSKRPTSPVLMRVFAKIGDYHNYEFLDKNRFLSVQLYDEAGETAAHAYCEHGSALAAFLSGDILRSGGSVKGYTVRLAFPPQAQSNHCVWLHEIVATRWLLDP